MEKEGEEKKKKIFYKKWWFWLLLVIITMAVIFIIYSENKLNSTTLELNKKVSIGRLTYYVKDDWKNKEENDANYQYEYYYPNENVLIMIMYANNEYYGNDTNIDICLNGYISGLSLNDENFIDKYIKDINNHKYGVVRYYSYVDNNKYEIISYITVNNDECYVFSISKKDKFDSNIINLIENIISKSEISIVEENNANNKHNEVREEKQEENNEIEENTNINSKNESSKVTEKNNNINTNNNYNDTSTKNINTNINISNTSTEKLEQQKTDNQKVENNTVKEDSTITIGEKNALSKAKTYIKAMAFSYEKLIEQLEYEGFSNSEAIYGANNCGANWNEQALKQAKVYLKTMSFSKNGLKG